MPVNERREGRLGTFAATVNEPLEQLPVGQAAGRARTKKCLDLFEEAHRRPDGKSHRGPATIGLEHPV